MASLHIYLKNSLMHSARYASSYLLIPSHFRTLRAAASRSCQLQVISRSCQSQVISRGLYFSKLHLRGYTPTVCEVKVIYRISMCPDCPAVVGISRKCIAFSINNMFIKTLFAMHLRRNNPFHLNVRNIFPCKP